MVAMAKPETTGFVVWEDDDIYLPWHISAHAQCLAEHVWSKPAQVMVKDNGKIRVGYTGGSYFASMGARKTHWGLENTKRADFDQAYMARLGAIMPHGDTQDYSPNHLTSYMFRWETTGHYHGQGRMVGGPSDEKWYDSFANDGDKRTISELVPRLDNETAQIWQQYTNP